MPNLRASALFTALTMYAQPAQTQQRFEVVSVKLSVPGADPLEHRQTRNLRPGRVRYAGVSLKDLMMIAYGLKDYQIIGPDWINRLDLDIEGTMGAGTTEEELRVMFQNLLVDRFKLTFDWGTKELPVYSIVVARSGPKMRESSSDAAPAPPVEGLLKLDATVFQWQVVCSAMESAR
jgi:uncharacterized protein (TIGR03435 family)